MSGLQTEESYSVLPRSWLNGEQRELNWARVIFHLDMDAFFAAVEVRNRPELRGKPVIVGGKAGSRGVVSACSYEARPAGVRSGMPLAQAQRLCPDAIFIEGSLKQYGHESARLMKILSEFTPLVEPFSVDEAFMDVSGSLKLYGDPIELARRIKSAISSRLELSCSIGIGPNKIIAKMSSKLQKPNGLSMLDQRMYRDHFSAKPAGSLWGVGRKTYLALKQIGVITASDLAESPESFLVGHLGRNGQWLRSLARGEDDSAVHGLDDLPDEKSISHETTFAKDSLNREYTERALLALSERVARRLRRGKFLARTISIKLRSADFETITRDRTLAEPTDDQRVIYETARSLIPREYAVSIAVRLIGVKGANLIKSADERQLSLFNAQGSIHSDRSDKLSHAIDSVKDRFGERALEPAALAQPGSAEEKRN